MKSRKLPIGSRRQRTESDARLPAENEEIEDVVEPEAPNDSTSDITPRPARPSRTSSRSSSLRDLSASIDESDKVTSSQISKLRGNRGDRGSQKLNKATDSPVASSNDKQAPKRNSTDSTRSVDRHRTTDTKSKKELPVRSSARRGSEQLHAPVENKLIAVELGGKRTTVSLILADRPYVVDDVNSVSSLKASSSPSSRASTASASTERHVGYDGNQYYCQVCSGFGDVVCCDGCPRVFHPSCIPNGASRASLEIDDDPWYCPECFESVKKKAKSNGSKKKTKNKTNKRKSDRAERRKSAEQGESSQKSNSSINRSVDKSPRGGNQSPEVRRQRDHDANDLEVESTVDSEVLSKTQESEAEKIDIGSVILGTDADDLNHDNVSKRKRRTSLSLAHLLEDDSQHESESQSPSDKKRNKKKKKRKHSMSVTSVAASDDGEASQVPIIDDESALPAKPPDIAHAVPAFYFFLTENRWKIERVLARKHRYFNRLPKGVERNELVATEAAMWWVKLRPIDHNRYMNMSMRDYELRIIEWKEEKNSREMGLYDESLHDDSGAKDSIPRNPQAEEDRLTFEKHERLFLSTSVGSKPFKPEGGQSYNRVLLDLLHDTRFHPLPMFFVNRPETDTVMDDHSAKVTIPFFEVHGPVSTSIGDECLGCTRGWLHFCPVLQRRLPAVEHRAKLQPPLSSLMATRVGLGLRPRLDRPDDPGPFVSDESDDGSCGILVWKESDEVREIKNLDIVQSCTVPDPGERVDDVVQFIEETTAMKVPEPPRPSLTDREQQKMEGRTNGNIEMDTPMFNKCGRCRTIIENDTGCVQCRRAQLVINKSKNQASASSAGISRSSKTGFKALKIHTAMLGRVQMKEGGGEDQSRSDQVVSEALLKNRWFPNAIMPPQTVPAPSPSKSARPFNEHSESDESSSESSGDETSELHDINQPIEQVEVEGLSSFVEDSATAERPTKRFRTARAASSIPAAAEPDRQEVMQQYKKEADELHKKTIQIASYGILLALMRRDPLHLFAHPVTAEGYNTFIQNPMDFGKIRDNVLSGKYSSLGSFASDVRLLCENALAYNPPSSIYFKTAKEMHDALAIMQKRAANWMSAIKDAHASFLLHRKPVPKRPSSSDAASSEFDIINTEDDPLDELRQKWPQAVKILESGDILRKAIGSDFMRTQENETAYYGCWAVRRAAVAAEASLSPYPDSNGIHSVVSKRKHYEDEVLRDHIDETVARLTDPIQLRNVSTWREEAIVRLIRKVQSRRLERRTISENGCSRCDGAVIDSETKVALTADSSHLGKTRRKGDFDVPRVDPTRVQLTTGLGSSNTQAKIAKRRNDGQISAYDTVNDACVSVRGSRIHGMGLYADQPFKKGDVVAEYLGEYIVNPVADEREKIYRDQRIQDYQFRLNDKLVIDATMKGGHGRYINHNCTPNCLAKIIPCNSTKSVGSEMIMDCIENGKQNDGAFDKDCGLKDAEQERDHHLLRRVMIIAQQDIDINEEITYDYQFPLELDLGARVPCNCQSEACRGFMNWDLPEKGSNNRALLVQKRGANMRDRIRRLNRPLKRGEV